MEKDLKTKFDNTLLNIHYLLRREDHFSMIEKVLGLGIGRGQVGNPRSNPKCVIRLSLLSSRSLNPHLYYEGLEWIISKLCYNTKIMEL